MSKGSDMEDGGRQDRAGAVPEAMPLCGICFLPLVPRSKKLLVLNMLIHYNQLGIENLAFDANMDHCVNT